VPKAISVKRLGGEEEGGKGGGASKKIKKHFWK